jgi:phage gp36-like protein
MNNISFIVSNGLNTSYIDSLLMALFYVHTELNEVLIQDPCDVKFVYLQELINQNFIKKVKNNYSIDISIINEIRNYSIMCGWKNEGNITDLYPVIDYMIFLMDGIGFGFICEDKLKYIEIYINYNTDIKTLLNVWINKHINFDTFDEFEKSTMLIPIYFNRTIGTSYKIDIKEKIKFRHNKISWIIHSIICFTNTGGGNYYTILKSNDNWFLFSNEKIPSLIEIQIKDVEISNKIKQECVLVFYKKIIN